MAPPIRIEARPLNPQPQPVVQNPFSTTTAKIVAIALGFFAFASLPIGFNLIGGAVFLWGAVSLLTDYVSLPSRGFPPFGQPNQNALPVIDIVHLGPDRANNRPPRWQFDHDRGDAAIADMILPGLPLGAFPPRRRERRRVRHRAEDQHRQRDVRQNQPRRVIQPGNLPLPAGDVFPNQRDRHQVGWPLPPFHFQGARGIPPLHDNFLAALRRPPENRHAVGGDPHDQHGAPEDAPPQPDDALGAAHNNDVIQPHQPPHAQRHQVGEAVPID